MKGVKRVKNTSSLSEQVEGQDSVDNFRLSAGVSDLNVKQLNPTLETGLDQERKKTEATKTKRTPTFRIGSQTLATTRT